MRRWGSAILVWLVLASLAGCGQQAQGPSGAPGITLPIVKTAPSQVTWSGDVDDAATVFLQGGKAWTDNVTKKGVDNATTTFDSPLHSAPVTVKLTNVTGRGQVNVIQQPTQTDNCTVGVRILDPQSGKGSYKFMLTW